MDCPISNVPPRVVCYEAEGVEWTRCFVPVGSSDRRKQRQHPRRKAMNWDQIEGKWKQYKGKVKEKWGKLTDDDIDVINGRRQQLVGKIQEHYGLAKDVAEKQADEFAKGLQEESKAQAKERGKAQRAGRG
jgi:uncharacterized protein YjbJ (UPF0337 family)